MSALPSSALANQLLLIDNASRCITTAALAVTPAKKPVKQYDFTVGDDKAEHVFVQFRAEYVAPLNNEINAALMLSALVGWYQPNGKGESKLRKHDSNGVWWIAKSHSHWLAELGLSRKESTRATEILVTSGVIEVWKYPFDGHACNHYRLKCADGGSMLNGVPSFKELAHVPGGHTAMYPAGTSSCTPGAQLITDIQTKTTTADTFKDFAGQNLPATSEHPEAPTGATGKPGNVKTITPSSLEVLPPPPHCAAPPAPAPDVVKPVKPLKGCALLESIWRTYLETEHKMYCGAFTSKQGGKIRDFSRRVRAAGFDPADTLRKLLSPQNKVAWDKIRSRIELDDPKAAVPPRPDLDFICTYKRLDVLITMMIERRNADAAQEAYLAQHSAKMILPAEPKPEPVAAPAPVAVPSVPEVKTDWLAELAALKKPAAA